MEDDPVEIATKLKSVIDGKLPPKDALLLLVLAEILKKLDIIVEGIGRLPR